MKKILVPTDFSEQAESALKVAAQFAKKTQQRNLPFTYARTSYTTYRSRNFW